MFKDEENIEKILRDENREKKNIAHSASKRKGSTHKVTLPHEHLSKKERAALNGEVVSMKLGEPTSFETFSKLSKSTQELYFNSIMNKMEEKEMEEKKILDYWPSMEEINEADRPAYTYKEFAALTKDERRAWLEKVYSTFYIQDGHLHEYFQGHLNTAEAAGNMRRRYNIAPTSREDYLAFFNQTAWDAFVAKARAREKLDSGVDIGALPMGEYHAAESSELEKIAAPSQSTVNQKLIDDILTEAAETKSNLMDLEIAHDLLEEKLKDYAKTDWVVNELDHLIDASHAMWDDIADLKQAYKSTQAETDESNKEFDNVNASLKALWDNIYDLKKVHELMQKRIDTLAEMYHDAWNKSNITVSGNCIRLEKESAPSENEYLANVPNMKIDFINIEGDLTAIKEITKLLEITGNSNKATFTLTSRRNYPAPNYQAYRGYGKYQEDSDDDED